MSRNSWTRTGARTAPSWRKAARSSSVPFIDLNDAAYTGFCFLDRIHMNDWGNDLTAGFLLEGMAAHGLN